MPRWLIPILLLLVLVVPAMAAAQDDVDEQIFCAELARYFGRPISGDIKWEIPKYMDAPDIKGVSKLGKGKPFDRWRLRETLRNFYLLGDVSNAAIMARDAADGQGVDVQIKIYPRYIVRDVRVVNSYSYSAQELLLDILHLEPGDDWHDENKKRYQDKLTAALARRGKLKATVKIDVTKTDRQDDNKVDLKIKPAERQTFKIIRFDFTGSELSIYTREEILKRAKWKDGMDFDQDRIESGLERLKKWLYTEGHREARVPELDLADEDTFDINYEKSHMIAKFPIKIGPRVDIWYDNECFTCAEMKWKFTDVLGLKNQRRFNEWIARDFAKRIKLYFQRQGYYLAEVDYEYQEFEEPSGLQVKRINLTSDKGPKVTIRNVDFKENDAFPDKTLQNLLKNDKIYVEEDFTKDLQNVINHYNANGFLRAKVAQKVVTFDERKKRIDIMVVIEEGPQTTLRSISFKDNEKLSDRKFQIAIAKMDEGLVVGEPLNPFLIQQTKAVLLSEYFKRGYAKARVRDSVTLSEDGKQVDIVFTFAEGIQYFFGVVYMRGNKLTKNHVIRRETVIVEGDPYNFEKIFRSEQSLIQLGFFNSVDISPVDPDLDSTVVDTMITVDERKSGYIIGGVGYNSFTGYSGAFEIGHKNLAGHGRRISYRNDIAVKDPSFRLDRRITSVGFTWPWIGRVPVDGTLIVRDADLQEIAYDVRSFSVTIGSTLIWRKLINFLEATHENPAMRDAAARNHGFFDPFTTKLDWEYARDFIFNIDPAVEDQEQGEITISTLSPMLIHDLRDHQFNPTRWTRNTIRFDYGPPWFLSQIHYLRVTGQTSWYLPIFEALSFLDGWVFAENVIVSHLQALRDTDSIPVSRRLFLGGSTTMRGFGQNQISPFGEDGETPVGGYFMAYQNTELRIPLPSNFGILGFFDAGDVTGGSNTYIIEEIRTTAGLGFRYVTPIGPISADYGFKLNRRTNETPGEFYITIGNAF
ncbi:MAG: POTRA domain-containing protein [Candidatus Lernaella stagnicola]|nr:POTRA domain-containing protein [Candidatus Lernaella stagnicola]